MAHDATLPARPRSEAPSWLVLVGFILLCQAAGLVGAATTDASFYRELERPGFAPPGWVFGPVWVTLYALMGTAAWIVWRTGPGRERRAALTLFAVQLALNAIWTPVFFGLRSLGGGLAVIIALNVAILATIVAFGRRSQLAAWMMVPYAAWVGFATALNATLVQLN